MVVITCDPANRAAVEAIVNDEGKLYCELLGETFSGGLDCGLDGKTLISADIAELSHSWSTSLESHLAEEVTA
jgi:hypothetical protein